ncbi:helicase C-terminal domain-containing protein [Mesobacillus subterraneus]|uniref:helicase C-terminal domain-containing protein n=1 Tax=Mesobacillus subterraneus TaxID=285983 RepID=UPI001CFD0E7E|nr:helicase C-terminal domain-containing protein [Mesobacillus subterraneus]WLR56918.1 helicase C-terminal domain-containing protein [Mesobacillus subterraneus]
MENQVRIPVRTLAEYVYKSGSIVSGFRTTSSFTEGSRIHREVQKTYSEHDQSEVFLKTEIKYEGLIFNIEGRCDGLLVNGDSTTIDEIKSTSLNLDLIDEETNLAHWAQAECYGYMYMKDQNLDIINIQLTYVQKTSGDIKRFIRTRTYGELKKVMMNMVSAFAPYARLRLENELKRDQSIKELKFPFDQYRIGQRQLAGSVYKTIQEGKTIFANAPTGIGKTISTIFPSVKAIGEGHLRKLFYLTAKTTTRQTAEEAFSQLFANGLHMKVVSITAKDKVCFTEQGICNNEHCEFADGYYDRINEAVLDILHNENTLDRLCIEKYAYKHSVCPFEFSLDLAYAADTVICDYNYIFDPKVSLKRLIDDHKKETVLLVDEAHNLVDRGREMFSSTLEKAPFLQLKREYRGRSKGIYEITKQVNDYFINIRKQAEPSKTVEFKEPLGEFNQLVLEFIDHAEKELLRESPGNSDVLLEAYFAAQNWQRISKLFDERFILYAEVGRNEVKLKQFCLDPSYLIKYAGKNFKSRIYFSATLSPIGYYMDMLGGEKEDYVLGIPSPFSSKQSQIKIQSLSTRFKDRDDSIKPIVKTLSETIEEKPGNYLIFFPSYLYLNSVLEEWNHGNPGIPTIVQGAGMTDVQREEFLESFKPGRSGSLVGFAVLGGVFSEGVDLKGDRLNGVIVVGVGLPQIGFERDLIKQHFSLTGKNGYDYAYVYPGMNKVLQAGGRLIRSEKDTGTIVLIDDRYLQHKYQNLLPDIWKGYTIF